MIEQSFVIVEAEQQRADHFAALGISKASDDAIGRAVRLDLFHAIANAGAIGQIGSLGD
jgi:hypothetical protein